jgi:hypothetical protein
MHLMCTLCSYLSHHARMMIAFALVCLVCVWVAVSCATRQKKEFGSVGILSMSYVLRIRCMQTAQRQAACAESRRSMRSERIRTFAPSAVGGSGDALARSRSAPLHIALVELHQLHHRRKKDVYQRLCSKALSHHPRLSSHHSERGRPSHLQRVLQMLHHHHVRHSPTGT